MKQENKPRAVKHLTYSKRDMYGNCYGFITVTNTKTGKSISVLVDSIGNEDIILNKMKLNFTGSSEMLPIREYNKQAKDLPYNYVEALHKLFGKSYKAYLAKEEKKALAIEKYHKQMRAKCKRLLAKENKRISIDFSLTKN